VPFALCGGYAAWARGAPEPEHDADFVVPEADRELAAEALTAAGLKVEEPPEDWLIKVVEGECFVDVLWRTAGAPVDTSLVERADILPVLSVEMPVMSATDVVITKLLALDEHYCDLGGVLPVMRALREQVDWDEVRKLASGSPFAETVLFLLERLDVISGADGDGR
jgi:hypothetical protein